MQSKIGLRQSVHNSKRIGVDLEERSNPIVTIVDADTKKGQCSAAGITCYSCGKLGHYSKRCSNQEDRQQRHSRNDRQGAPPPKQNFGQRQRYPAQRGTFMQQRLHTMEEEESTSTREDVRYLDEEYVLDELKSSDCDTGGTKYEWHEELSIDGGENIRFKLDSGATCNVLPFESYRRIKQSGGRLDPGPRVRNYGAKGGYLNVMGVFEGVVKRHGVSFKVKFIVVDEPGQPPILGLPTCNAMQLIKRVHSVSTEKQRDLPPVVNEFQDVFVGIGKLPVVHDIKLATGPNFVDPVVCAASRLPFLLEGKVYKKLDQMVKDEIIVPVVEPT
jgi:hypothetical protein